MEFTIHREVPGRLRVKLTGPIPEEDITALSSIASRPSVVLDVRVYPRARSMAITYRAGNENRAVVLEQLRAITRTAIELAKEEKGLAVISKAQSLMLDLAVLVGSFALRRFFLPSFVATLITVWRYRKFLWAALRSLGKSHLDVPVLDAAAIAMSFVKGDPKTASETMFLLDIGETMEDYTRARSEDELIKSLLDIPETVMRVVPSSGDEPDDEESVAASAIEEGDLVVVRTGQAICIDGVIERGMGMVNQAALTGEPLAVERTIGDDVFAGTALEDGEIFIRVKANTSDTKLRSIVTLVQQSESNKSEVQMRMDAMANGIVPWNFLLAGAVALVTRDIIKTSAALMVDYSCALRLTGSIAVLTAMSQSARLGFTVKGAQSFDDIAQADTIVFDKTGTLTNACPTVEKVLAFEGWNRREVLRFAACLEEHFPHPVARAVVHAAAEKNLKHREKHAQVEYIVAHGIASSLDGKRAAIGSEHFIVEDEGVKIDPSTAQKIEAELDGRSPLYLAVDGRLVGVVGIEDPLKRGASAAIAQLRKAGFKRIIMLTGDNEHTAQKIAYQAGITEYGANMLPEDKYAYVDGLKKQGCKVLMVGDGVNDSPALSRADVGVAMGQGTAIAREVANVTLIHSDLEALVDLRKLSNELQSRLRGSFKQVMVFNSLLLAAGISGLIQPQTSSLLHNGSTIVLSAACGRKYRIPPTNC